MEQEAERTKKMLARFLKNCESIVSQGVVSFMLHVCIENQSQGAPHAEVVNYIKQ